MNVEVYKTGKALLFTVPADGTRERESLKFPEKLRRIEAGMGHLSGSNRVTLGKTVESVRLTFSRHFRLGGTLELRGEGLRKVEIAGNYPKGGRVLYVPEGCSITME